MKRLHIKKRASSVGFTLVEIMVSVTIFSFVMLMVVSMLLAIVDANVKAQTLKTTLDNLNVALDDMSRTIRTGSDYICTGSNPPTSFSFTDQDGNNITYSFDPTGQADHGSIDRAETPKGSSVAVTIPLTGTDVAITNANFIVENCDSEVAQPYVVILVQGTAGNQNHADTGSSFSIETTISQRGIGSSSY